MASFSPAAAIRLLRTGIVPGSAVADLSVGYARVRSDFDAKLESFIYGKRQAAQFVQGEWGSGKSHFLAFCQTLANDIGLPVAYVSLNARSVALNYPQRIYSELVAGLRVVPLVGARGVLHSLLVDSHIRKRLTAYAAVTSDSFCWSVGRLCEYYENSDPVNPRTESIWSYILGEDLAWADYAYKRDQALDRIEALARCFRVINGAGLLLLLDEVETIDQLWNYRSRLVGYRVLARIARMEGVWMVLAITNRFSRVAALDLARMNGEAEVGEARAFLGGVQSGSYSIFPPPSLDKDRAVRLANAVASLYREAYPHVTVSASQLSQCVEEWSRNPARNPRRLIRIVVNQMDLLRPPGVH